MKSGRAEELMKETEEGVVRDAGIIGSSKKVEHYEIASYDTLRTFALALGYDEAATVLQETLGEEKESDETLTGIAESSINAEVVAGSDEKEDSETDSSATKMKKLKKK